MATNENQSLNQAFDSQFSEYLNTDTQKQDWLQPIDKKTPFKESASYKLGKAIQDKRKELINPIRHNPNVDSRINHLKRQFGLLY